MTCILEVRVETEHYWKFNLDEPFLWIFVNFHLNKLNRFAGFEQEEQTPGPDSGTGWHRGQVPGEPDHGQGQVQGEAQPHLQSRQSNHFLQIGKNTKIRFTNIGFNSVSGETFY